MSHFKRYTHVISSKYSCHVTRSDSVWNDPLKDPTEEINKTKSCDLNTSVHDIWTVAAIQPSPSAFTRLTDFCQ